MKPVKILPEKVQGKPRNFGVISCLKSAKNLAITRVLWYHGDMKNTVNKTSEMEQKMQLLEAQNAELLAQNSELLKQNAEQAKLIGYYVEQFKLAQRRQFGLSSEQSPAQLHFDNIFNEAEDQADPEAAEPTYEEITYKRRKRPGKKTDDLSGLTVEHHEYELPEHERVCPECGGDLHDIGTTNRDELKIIPAQVIHVEHAVHAYACRNCEKNSDHAVILKAEAPAPLISGSLATPSAVAHIANEKYVNATPLYRLEKGFSYDGIVLSRQTMANWLVYCFQNYLLAFYLLLKDYLLEETVLHADETTVQVLQEPGREAKTKSYEWLYRTGACAKRQIAIYEYRETRNQEHPREFLKGFKGFLHTDGYQVYHNLPPDITVVGCWSHTRRYWEKLYESIDKEKRDGSNAERGLVYINLLFAYERDFRELSPDERLKKRLELCKPVSDDFFEWVGSLTALPKSLFGEAVHYSLSQREYLENIYLDGRLECSNNRAERAIKPFVQGRKQWLFSNTPNGAEASSGYYSLIETAKANNLNPFQYLKYLLEKLPTAKTNEMESLLPWSTTLPECCRIPLKTSNINRNMPKEPPKRGHLHDALVKLKRHYEMKSNEGST